MFNFLKDFIFHNQNLNVAAQERIFQTEVAHDNNINFDKIKTFRTKNYITRNSKKFLLDWDKFVHFNDRPLFSIPSSNYRTWKENARDIRQLVVHWDVCLSSKHCLEILKKRGLSVHFLIDNDGTIIQTMDLDHKALHAGNNMVNKHSIGVEVSNAWYLKYQDWYIKNGYGQRPIWKDVKVHNTILEPFLGFFDVQIQALRELTQTLINANIIQQSFPADSNANMLKTVSPEVVSGQFRGVVNHYHITKNKIDCAGLDLEKIIF